jgi:hypothetical protein
MTANGEVAPSAVIRKVARSRDHHRYALRPLSQVNIWNAPLTPMVGEHRR